MSQLQGQLSLLDPAQLDHADARIQGLLQHLNQVKEKKKTAEDAGKESKVSEDAACPKLGQPVEE